jgi:hypothetical protein
LSGLRTHSAPLDRRRPLATFADLAALGLCALYLAVAVPAALYRAAANASLAVAAAGESETAARARVYDQAFVAAVDGIRRAVPAGDPYLLIEEGDPEAGAANWVRYELAPRRAILVRGGRGARWLGQTVPAGIRWVVVARGGEPPTLHTRFDYLHRRGDGG